VNKPSLNPDAESLALWALDEAVRQGASSADVLYSETSGNSVSMKDGVVEESVSGFNAGIGVRTIMSDGRQGIAYGSRLDIQAVRSLVEWSIFNCRNSEPEEGIMLYDGKLEEDPSVALEDERIAQITPKMRLEMCLNMTELAKSKDGRVVSVRSAAWSDGWGSSFYCTTTGLAGWERVSSASCGVLVLAQEGDFTEIGGYNMESRRLDELDVGKTAALAVSRTVSALGGTPMPTGVYTIMIEPEAASALVDVVGDLFCASDVHKGRSLMKDRLGSAVASSCVTLTDDGRLPWKAGSGSWDSEGVPTGRTVLIKNGTAQSYLYNLQYAWKDGVRSTGNACRSMSSLPDVGTTNVFLEGGSESAESLLARIKSGLYVTEFMGLHTIDPVSGDFSIGAKGLAIENGELTKPVCGVTIASNIMNFLRDIAAAGSDVEFFGAVGAPALVVENVVIAGE